MAQAATRVALVCAAASLTGVLTALLAWRALAPTEPALPQVPFAAFLSAVQLGVVDDVHVDGSVYTFRTYEDGHPRAETRQTTGPVPDIAQVRALRPSSPGSRRPRVYFER